MSLADLSLPVAVLAGFLAVAWAMGGLLLPLWLGLVRRFPGATRWALAVAALPWLAGAALALGALLPGDPHTGQMLSCHCLESMPSWMHLCPVHPAEAAALVPAALLVLVVLLPARVRGLAALLREPRGRGGGGQPRVVELDAPLAMLHGWLHPTLVVDRGLWETLDGRERAVVVAHERGHLLRRDPLMLMVLRVLLVLAPARLGVHVARVWLDRAELRADAEAARRIGDPSAVAAVLLRCARLGVAAPPLTVAWTGGSLEQRVHALLEGAVDEGRARPDVGLVDLGSLALLAALAVLATPWVHHQVEHLLNLSF